MASKVYTSVYLAVVLCMFTASVNGHWKSKSEKNPSTHSLIRSSAVSCPPGTRMVVDTDTAGLSTGNTVPRCEPIAFAFIPQSVNTAFLRREAANGDFRSNVHASGFVHDRKGASKFANVMKNAFHQRLTSKMSKHSASGHSSKKHF